MRPLRTLARSPVLSVLSALTTLYLGGVMLAVVQFAAAAERKLKPCRLWLPVFQVLTKALADLQSSFARMGGKLPPSATAVVPLKPKAKRKPKGNKPRAPESP